MDSANLRTAANARPLALILLAGVTLRMALTFHDPNYDVVSYRIVADIMARGGNVYVQT